VSLQVIFICHFESLGPLGKTRATFSVLLSGWPLPTAGRCPILVWLRHCRIWIALGSVPSLADSDAAAARLTGMMIVDSSTLSSSSDSTARARAASEAQAGPCRFKSADSESASPHPQAATASLTRRVWQTQWRTRTRMPLAVGVSACPPLSPPPPARICQYMRVYASICKYMHVYARMCRWSGQKTTKCEKHVCARICTYMHVYECIWKYDGIRYRKCPFSESVSPPVTVGCTHDVSSWLGWSATAV